MLSKRGEGEGRDGGGRTRRREAIGGREGVERFQLAGSVESGDWRQWRKDRRQK